MNLSGNIWKLTLNMPVMSKRLTSYYVNKTRTFDWMKNDDSALKAEMKRSRFLVFYDKQPLLTKSTNTTGRYSLAWIPHDRLQKVALDFGISMDQERTALIDVVPMQSHTNDTNEEFIPVLTLGIRADKRNAAFNKEDKLAHDLCNGSEFVDLRRALFLVDDAHNATLLAKAQALLRWASSFKYCPKCASPLKLKISKAFANCAACSQIYYPTVSPVAISLITDPSKDHLLLVRQPRNMKGIFTAVAGFCEVGESLEQTVRREIAEEVGVDVDKIEYASISQAWPFPQNSLMCAFVATASSRQHPNVDKSELEDAAWFTRDEVMTAFRNTTDDVLLNHPEQNTRKFAYIPPLGAVAHDLIKRWLLIKE